VLIAAAAVAALFAADRVVASRMFAMPFGGSLGPVEVVRGGKPRELPLAVPGRESIASSALREVVADGEATGSHALLIWHDGALQLEHYYPGYGPDTRTPTQSMHKSILALLFGTAVRDGYIGCVDDPVGRCSRNSHASVQFLAPHTVTRAGRPGRLRSGDGSTAFSPAPASSDPAARAPAATAPC
jgi:CubicO group peptidase (beta-lactamase class C family)